MQKISLQKDYCNKSCHISKEMKVNLSENWDSENSSLHATIRLCLFYGLCLENKSNLSSKRIWFHRNPRKESWRGLQPFQEEILWHGLQNRLVWYSYSYKNAVILSFISFLLISKVRMNYCGNFTCVGIQKSSIYCRLKNTKEYYLLSFED
jgi:hypothetical protein